MKIKPSKKQVVVRPTALTGSGLEVIEQTEKKKPEVGKIIAVGEGKQPIPMKKGDVIAYRSYAGSTFYFDGQETIFVGFDDILGVIKNV